MVRFVRGNYRVTRLVMAIGIVGLFLFSGLSGVDLLGDASAFSIPPTTVTIGSSTSNYQKEPLDINYQYHCDAALYLASEIGMAGTIVDIRWNRAQANQDQIFSTTISMREVGDSDLTSARYDSCSKVQEGNSAGTLVFKGDLYLDGTTTGWYPTVHLKIPFVYSGKKNLLVSFRHQSWSYYESSYSTYYYTSSTGMFRTGSHTIQNPPTFSSASDQRPNFQIDIVPNRPSVGPMLISPMDNAKIGTGTSSTTPTLTWNNPVDPDGDSLHYQLQVTTNPNFAAQKTIAPGASGNQRAPLDIAMNYHCNAAIYTQSELGGPMTITKIRWYRGLSSGPDEFRRVTIYMSHTTNSSFASDPTLSQVQVGTLVYEGIILYTDPSIVGYFPTIVLDTPFEYNGVDNLILSLRHRDRTLESSFSQYQYYTMSEYKFAKWAGTTDESNPTLPRSYNRPNVQFEYLSTVIRKDSSVSSTGFSTVPAPSGTGTTSYTIQSSEALTDGTTYYWRVRARDAGTELWGAWSGLYFENFNDDSSVPSDWTVKDGQWSIQSDTTNRLQGESGRITYMGAPGRSALGWMNYTFEVTEKDVSTGSEQSDVGHILFRTTNPDSATYSVHQQKDGTLVLAKKCGGSLTQNTTSSSYIAEKVYKIEVKGQQPGNVMIRITFDGNIVTAAWTSSDGWWTDTGGSLISGVVFNAGTIGFEARSSTARFDDVSVQYEVNSFTVDTTYTFTAWHQTMARQFSEEDQLISTTARVDGNNDVILSSTVKNIGSEVATQYAPLDVYNAKYYCDGSLYMASEIGISGLITKIRWNRYYYDADQINGITIYMKETTDTDLSSSSYDTCSELQSGTLVWSGDLSLDGSTQGWYPEVQLTTPFQYGGTQNLIVSVRHQDGSQEATGSSYKYTSGGNYQKVRRGISTTENPPPIDAASSSKPNIQFEVWAPTGTVVSPPIQYNDIFGLLYGWYEVSWAETSGGGTSDVLVKVQYWNGLTWTDITGKSSTSSPIFIYDLNPFVYSKIRLIGTLEKGNGATPELKDWTLVWMDPNGDPDHDGLITADEIDIYGTYPDNADSDNDGLYDGYLDVNNNYAFDIGIDYGEVFGWGISVEGQPVYVTSDPTTSHSDTDTLSDGEEYDYGTNPQNPDTDEDDLNDNIEINTYYTDPTREDTDYDGMPDGWEVQYGLKPLDDGTYYFDYGPMGDLDSDTLTNLVEYQRGGNPNADDTDQDGLHDNVETGTTIYVSLQNTGTFLNDMDSDNDGIIDGEEVDGLLFRYTAGQFNHWGSSLPLESSCGYAASDGGVAIAQLDNNPKLDVLMMTIDDGEFGGLSDDTYRYKIGKNIDTNGMVTWSSCHNPNQNVHGKLSSGGGVAIANLDDDPRLDAVFMGIDEGTIIDNTNYFYYRIALNYNSTTENFDWQVSKKVDVELGDDSDGGGVSLADIDNDQYMEAIFMAINAPNDEPDNYQWIILDAFSKADNEFKTIYQSSYSLHDEETGTILSEGGDVSFINANNVDTLDAIFSVVDAPVSGERNYRYRIAYDIDPTAAVFKGGWSEILGFIPSGSEYSDGGGITAMSSGLNIDIDDNGFSDALFMHIDAVTENHFSYRIAYDYGRLDPNNPDTDGDGFVDGWMDLNPDPMQRPTWETGEPLGEIGDWVNYNNYHPKGSIAQLIHKIDPQTGKCSLDEEPPNPIWKDVYVEIDWFVHHQPGDEIIGMLKEPFRRNGINIHLYMGKMSGGEELDGYLDSLSLWADNTPLTNDDYYDVKRAHFANERKGYFHYVLFAHEYSERETAQGATPFNRDTLVMDGDDSIIADDNINGDNVLRAYTLMHELGHQFGLVGLLRNRQGLQQPGLPHYFNGIDSAIWGKNDYPSCMSYADPFTLVDYSIGPDDSQNHNDWADVYPMRIWLNWDIYEK